MRQFLAQFRLTVRQWLALGVIAGFLALVVYLVLTLQARDYQRLLDSSTLRTVAELRAEYDKLSDQQEAILKAIADLRAKDQQSAADRREIRHQVETVEKNANQLKEQVKTWR